MANSRPGSIKSAVPNLAGHPKDRFSALYEESQKFCEGVGLQKDLIITILKTDSDWAFVLKVDALLESASKPSGTASASGWRREHFRTKPLTSSSTPCR